MMIKTKLVYTIGAVLLLVSSSVFAADVASFEFKENDQIAIIGNGLGERLQQDGWTETLLQSELAGKNLSFRNMTIPGDTPTKFPRNKGFMPQDQYLKHVKADVIWLFFGYSESFQGAGAAANHTTQLVALANKFKALKPNGTDEPRIVMFAAAPAP